MLRFMAAFIVGIAYVYGAIAVWGVYSVSNPVNALLIEVLASEGYATLYTLARIGHQLVFNALIALPFVLLLILLKRFNAWGYLVAFSLAVALVATWSVRGSITEVGQAAFWLDAVVLALSPCLALAGIRAFRS
jgi:hypothetical protein